jgi:hypothetical protein
VRGLGFSIGGSQPVGSGFGSGSPRTGEVAQVEIGEVAQRHATSLGGA